MTTDIDEQGRHEPPLEGDEWETLTGFLDFQRATLGWKTSGLGAEALARTLPPSTMTLAGLLKHLAYVEDDWFCRWLRDEPRRQPWSEIDWSATPDWDWDSAVDDEPAVLRHLWGRSVARARTAAEDAYRDGGLDHPAARTWPDGRSPSLRWILVHMIEEYARHNGHADLLREAVDGLVGE
ncbi:DinB family protein [Georgenia sp. Z1491]|uniref:DinB family protein n=1 Tax=Georgenia sp. Z1491 TaxID=3416707 RepID=UPI003CEEE2CC